MYMTTAIAVAKRALASCVKADGIIAGRHHFVDLWARDSLFASFGATVSGNGEWSRRTIESFVSRQRQNGQVPFLIRRSKLTLGKYLGYQTYLDVPIAQFRSSQSGGTVPDGGLLIVIASSFYADYTRNRAFVAKHYGKLARALALYEDRFGDALIREWFQCEWADAVLKRGMTLYTNVLYWYALTRMARMSRMLGNSREEKRWQFRAALISRELRSQLWNGSYFADWKGIIRHDYFVSHGNMLAIAFGLTTCRESQRILDEARRRLWNGFTLETNDPKYPAWRVPLVQYLTGMGDYHNRGCLWLQPGIWYAIALHRTGKRREAKNVLTAIAKKLVEYDGVFEVYEKSGRPVRRLLYKSEQPFAWSAGLFLYASHILR